MGENITGVKKIHEINKIKLNNLNKYSEKNNLN